MLRRKIEKELVKWKNSTNRTPLIIRGCRQCGKTFSALKFAKEQYKNVIYINFFENPAYKVIFEESLAIDDLVLYITAALGSQAIFEVGSTCLVLDEIQECPKARSSLKFFKMDGRFDVICTGSLLGIKGYRDDAMSIPVGYESVIEMTPLDFEEFLWANGINDSIIDRIKQCLQDEIPIPNVIHLKMHKLLLEYVTVGGMPAVVNEFIESHQMNAVIKIQRDIVASYRDDMIKYASGGDKSKIRECFDSIPKQLSKENKKFQYAVIRKGSTASKYQGSLQWIEDAGIIRRCYNLNITELPLDGNAQIDTFKVYMADIGLFISMLEDGIQNDILHGSLLGYKGAIFENLVADILGKMGRKLYYFRKESGLEIDFVFRYKGSCTLLEVKAETGNVKSSKTILSHPEKYHVYQCIKLGHYNIGRVGSCLTLPLYTAFLLIDY